MRTHRCGKGIRGRGGDRRGAPTQNTHDGHSQRRPPPVRLSCRRAAAGRRAIYADLAGRYGLPRGTGQAQILDVLGPGKTSHQPCTLMGCTSGSPRGPSSRRAGRRCIPRTSAACLGANLGSRAWQGSSPAVSSIGRSAASGCVLARCLAGYVCLHHFEPPAAEKAACVARAAMFVAHAWPQVSLGARAVPYVRSQIRRSDACA